MTITATETHRLGSSVHLAFTDDAGKDLYPGGRYVDAADWDADPERVTAEVADYLNKQSAPVKSTIAVKPPLTMTAEQVTAKLKVLADTKKSADAQSSEASTT